MRNSVLIRNCRLYNSLIEQDLADILIEGKVIKQIEKLGEEVTAETIIDAGGRLVTPGFIDIHIQGAGGADILDNSLDSLERMSQTLARTGTTAFLGTTVVKPEEENRHLKLCREYVGRSLGGAMLLGFHLEGPFINFNKKGGLNPTGIYAPSEEKLQEILDILQGTLKMMTIAPELPGNLELIKQLTSQGVIASFAHSEADYEETLRGFEAGISHVTHIFNAMRPISHRNPGPLPAIFEQQGITAQIISDGHHIHPSIVNMLYKLLGKEGCICITDGMPGIGLPEGSYLYNGKEYESKQGAARYLDGTLIGSTMSLPDITMKFMEFTGCSLESAVNAATINPARLLKIEDRKGSIEPGKDADIVIFDGDKSVFTTLINGQVAYQK
ncbi:MAG: N-acetylglucosamine-6-phosphate deacetylase [Methanococcaceae archaeon]